VGAGHPIEEQQARAVIDGLGESQAAAGVDLGAAEEVGDVTSQPAAAEPATA